MAEFWERAFVERSLMWGEEPTLSAQRAGGYLEEMGARSVLIPGFGYGRNAKPFLERGMSVVGIEISETAIVLAREVLGGGVLVHHGSVEDMPFDDAVYDGVFCYGLIHLLDAEGRTKHLQDCWEHVAPGGSMVFAAISKKAPMYGQGKKLGDDWFERLPNLPMYFYDADAVKREFGSYGLVEYDEVDEPSPSGSTTLPFWYVVCRKGV